MSIARPSLLSLLLLGALVALVATPLAAPVQAADPRYEIRFPDLPGYRTLACDLHTHTVFSDGQVWPTTRVDEAWRMGLDALAITDHIEYQPHRADIPTNHNRPYELAVGPARAHDVLLVKGAEITRDTPPGHFNAVFLDDCAALDTKEFLDAIRIANEQGAFVFWNHQGWKGPELGRWMDVHTTMYENKWFQGMEVCNGGEYYPDAHKWCLEKNLTMLGTSDIHAPDLLRRNTAEKHRTMTLVFARERTLASLKEALFEGRTVVWYQNRLIGRREWLEPLFHASVEVEPPHQRTDRFVWVKIRNRCETDVELERTAGPGPAKLVLPAGAVTLLRLSAAKPQEPIELGYTATNWLVAPETGLPVVLRVQGVLPPVPVDVPQHFPAVPRR
jgi:3',5'-nucleoside bisphosphate phosphatase